MKKMNLKSNLIPIATFIRKRQNGLKLGGFCFFIFSLIGGVFWLSGYEIEPLVFVLSVIASSLWGLRLLADYISPPRKKISEMNKEELFEFIMNSDSKTDWTRISTPEKVESYLNEDPRLRFSHSHLDDGIQEKRFSEKWANCHPDSNASGHWYDLLYDGNKIERFLMVSVDGHRALLPPPVLTTNKVKIMDYKVALINDYMNSCNDYIRRSKLEIENHT